MKGKEKKIFESLNTLDTNGEYTLTKRYFNHFYDISFGAPIGGSVQSEGDITQITQILKNLYEPDFGIYFSNTRKTPKNFDKFAIMIYSIAVSGVPMDKTSTVSDVILQMSNEAINEFVTGYFRKHNDWLDTSTLRTEFGQFAQVDVVNLEPESAEEKVWNDWCQKMQQHNQQIGDITNSALLYFVTLKYITHMLHQHKK